MDPNLQQLLDLYDWPAEHIYLCARCGNEIPEGEKEAEYWKYYYADHEFWEISLCSQCTVPKGRCVKCGVWLTSKEDIPLCASCLKSYFASILDAYKQNSECRNCGVSIPFGEFDRYVNGDFLCDSCRHSEFDIQHPLVELRESWSFEDNIIDESYLRLAPDDVLTGRVELITDIRLIKYIDEHPMEVYSLLPRQFEELVADLLQQFGYTRVKLGPRGRDGGVDVYAERDDAGGRELTLVQCKRHRRENKVGEPIVKQLHADINDRAASRGVVVTTSFFTRNALDYIAQRRFRLAGVDFDRLQTWIKQRRLSNSSGTRLF